MRCPFCNTPCGNEWCAYNEEAQKRREIHLAEYMDSLLGLWTALFEGVKNAPVEMKQALQSRNVEDVEVEEVSACPTKNIAK